MPVIGRLDEQVERVLIRPPDRQDPPETAEAAHARAATDAAHPAPDTPQAVGDKDVRQAPATDDRPPVQPGRPAEELPVWLL